MQVVYELADSHVALLRKRYGKLVHGELPELKEPVFVVGDASANFVLNNGIRPQIVVYDRKVERRRVPEDMELAINEFEVPEVCVKNPQSTITKQLLDAIRQGLKKRSKIFVDGEDDLAAVAILALAESGTLLYGLPGEGMVVMDVRKGKKELKKVLESIKIQQD